jgi:hypothetical protein
LASCFRRCRIAHGSTSPRRGAEEAGGEGLHAVHRQTRLPGRVRAVDTGSTEAEAECRRGRGRRLGWRPRWHRRQLPIGGHKQQVGTFTLDVVDVAKNAQVWSGSVDVGIQAQQISDEEADEAVRVILEKFPDRAAK